MTCTDPCNCDQSLALLAEIEELRRWQTEAIASLTAVGWSTTDPGSLGRCLEVLNETYRSAQNDGLLAAERSLRHQIERERLTACRELDSFVARLVTLLGMTEGAGAGSVYKAIESRIEVLRDLLEDTKSDRLELTKLRTACSQALDAHEMGSTTHGMNILRAATKPDGLEGDPDEPLL